MHTPKLGVAFFFPGGSFGGTSVGGSHPFVFEAEIELFLGKH